MTSGAPTNPVATMSNTDAPSVQISPTRPFPTCGDPDRERRVCTPTSVPGIAVHADHAAPSNLAHRMVLAESVLTTHTNTFKPSLAANTPAPALAAWPCPNAGGAGDIDDHELPATLYDAASMPPPFVFRRNT